MITRFVVTFPTSICLSLWNCNCIIFSIYNLPRHVNKAQNISMALKNLQQICSRSRFQLQTQVLMFKYYKKGRQLLEAINESCFAG